MDYLVTGDPLDYDEPTHEDFRIPVCDNCGGVQDSIWNLPSHLRDNHDECECTCDGCGKFVEQCICDDHGFGEADKQR